MSDSPEVVGVVQPAAFEAVGPAAPTSFAELAAAVAPHRARLLEHEVYSLLVDARSIRIFMEHHCYAVMDFMCLLKSLQQRLTVVAVPWFPPANAEAARFINEIVLGEESDVAPGGGYISHYGLYINAMKEAGARTEAVEGFVELARNHHHYRRAFARANVPMAARAFVGDSMGVCQTGKNHEIAAYFLFGRENLIPDLFRRIVERLRGSGERGLDGLIYYLDRHIQIDEGEHGPAAEKMLTYLVDGQARRWADAHKVSLRAVKARYALWDAIAAALRSPDPSSL